MEGVIDGLFYAASQDRINDVKRLLVCYDGTKALKCCNANGSTLLHICAKYNAIEVMKLLLAYKVIDVNKLELRSAGGYAAIHYACQQNNIPSLYQLILAGADINLKTASDLKESPLHICCKNGRTECAKILLAEGADKTIRDAFGHNASFWAYSNRHFNMIAEAGLPPVVSASAKEHIAATGTKFHLAAKKTKKGKGKGTKKKK